MVAGSQGCDFFFLTPNTQAGGGWAVRLPSLGISPLFAYWYSPWRLSYTSWGSGLLLDSPFQTILTFLFFIPHTPGAAKTSVGDH